MFGAAILGAVVSGCFTAVFFLFPGSGLIPWRLWLILWPTSIVTMALANPGPWTETALVFAIAVTSNILVYAVVAPSYHSCHIQFESTLGEQRRGLRQFNCRAAAHLGSRCSRNGR